jgi:Spy/CpxP family protein refolding chaperone
MYPGMISWWKRARRAAAHGGEEHFAHGGSGERGPRHGGWRGRHGCGPDVGPGAWAGPWGHHGPHGDGADFGVRRPLRFLAFKLELDDKQVAELAKVLDELKTERAQAAVDDRRTAAAFAEAVAAEAFDEAAVREAASLRVKTAERLRDAVTKALGRIHSVLTAEQRQGFSYLVRTGALTI